VFSPVQNAGPSFAFFHIGGPCQFGGGGDREGTSRDQGRGDAIYLVRGEVPAGIRAVVERRRAQQGSGKEKGRQPGTGKDKGAGKEKGRGAKPPYSLLRGTRTRTWTSRSPWRSWLWRGTHGGSPRPRSLASQCSVGR